MAALAIASLALPFSLPMKACSASRPFIRISSIVLLETLALAPPSHSIFTLSSAVLACHQVSATTAIAESPIFTTFFTPGIFSAAAAS